MGQIQANPGMENGNDLTAIKGIGPARQQWFKESLNVSTYEDLAALSAEEVEAAFDRVFSLQQRKDGSYQMFAEIPVGPHDVADSPRNMPDLAQPVPDRGDELLGPAVVTAERPAAPSTTARNDTSGC